MPTETETHKVAVTQCGDFVFLEDEFDTLREDVDYDFLQFELPEGADIEAIEEKALTIHRADNAALAKALGDALREGGQGA